MTKKDYELIAEAILYTKKELHGYGDSNGVLNTLRDNMGRFLASENTRFDLVKFFKACNFDGKYPREVSRRKSSLEP